MWKNDWIRQEKKKIAYDIRNRLNLQSLFFVPEAKMTPCFTPDGTPYNLLEVSDGIFYGYEAQGKMVDPVKEIKEKKYKAKRVGIYCNDFFTAEIGEEGEILFTKHHSDIPVLLDNYYYGRMKFDEDKIKLFDDYATDEFGWRRYNQVVATKEFIKESTRIIEKYEKSGKTQRFYKYRDASARPSAVVSATKALLDVHPMGEGYTFQRFHVEIEIENGEPIASDVKLINFVEFLPGALNEWIVKDGNIDTINPLPNIKALLSTNNAHTRVSDKVLKENPNMPRFSFDGLIRKTIAPNLKLFEERNFMNTTSSIYNKPLSNGYYRYLHRNPTENPQIDLAYRAFKPFSEGGECVIPEFVLSWAENGNESYGSMYFWATMAINEGITEKRFQQLIKDSRFKFLMFAFGSADEHWMTLSKILDKAKLESILEFVFYSGIKLGKTIHQTMSELASNSNTFDAWLKEKSQEVL